MAKKEKLEALVPPEEQPYPVPENWRWVRFAGVSESICDGVHFAPEYVETGIPCYSAKDVYDDAIHDDKCYYICQKDYDDMKNKINVKQGSVLVTKSGSIGRSAVVDKYYEFGLVESIGVVNLRIGQPGYLKRWLDLGFVYSNNLLERHTTGTTIKHLTLRLISDIAIPFPPLQEQKRILSCIESLFAKLDEAKEKAQAVVDGFEDRKAAILHKAFAGELTEKWRNERGIDINSWCKLKISEFAKVRGGKRLPKGESLQKEKTNHPYIRIADLDDDTVDLSDIHYISEEVFSKINRYIIEQQDVYISIVGTIGKCGTIPACLDGANLTENAARITSEITLPRYLALYLNSPLCQEEINGRIRSATLGKLSLYNINEIVVPIPVIDEQQEIIDYLEKLLQNEKLVKESAENLIEQIDDMKKSILAKAFRGELGTNDPAEPPVDIM